MPMIRILALVLFVAGTLHAAEPVQFRTDVIAAFSRAGCNQGACHGSPQGKNGFRLSLRGYDPDLDYATLVREQGGRRVNRVSPESSLILLKGTGHMPHQGGRVLAVGEAPYQMIVRWITEGCQDSGPSTFTKLEALAGEANGSTRQLTARAHFKDGTSRDVTALAVFTSSNPEIAPVMPSGLVQFKQTGEASILVRFLDRITSIRLTHVERDPKFTFRAPRAANFIDEHVFAKQKELQLLPAGIARDEIFLRRVYLDVIGELPTPEEAIAFLDSKAADKRSNLIDALLDRDEYANFWALKWADVLRGSPTTISERGVHSFHRYLVKTVADDRPITEFARELLTGLGNTLDKPQANFYRVARTPEEAAESAAQLFMGVRVQCAKCHNHPFEAITQDDYFGLAAFFARVQFKGAQFGGDEEIVFLQSNREVQHPKTHKNQPPTAFGSSPGMLGPDDDRRERFAEWLTAPGNRFFAPSVVNRIWFHLIGKGIVDPVDDFRDTNPPSNPQLLQALCDDFAKHGYRMKPLIRTILNSNTYQLASTGGPAQSPLAAKRERYFTQAAIRMLSAEQILDATSSATGVPEKFTGFPLGTRAIELPEGGVNHPFLQAFSKPVRDVTCECAREEDPSLPGVLHLLNNANLLAKVKSPDSRVARWINEKKEPAWIVEQVYLATLSRRPTEREREVVMKHLRTLADPAEGLHDLQHALLNVNEFLLRH
jgi:hypothetical protein